MTEEQFSKIMSAQELNAKSLESIATALYNSHLLRSGTLNSIENNKAKITELINNNE